jgi:hypothetical protein
MKLFRAVGFSLGALVLSCGSNLSSLPTKDWTAAPTEASIGVDDRRGRHECRH